MLSGLSSINYVEIIVVDFGNILFPDDVIIINEGKRNKTAKKEGPKKYK